MSELHPEILKLTAVVGNWDGRGGKAPSPQSIDLVADFLPTIRSVRGMGFSIQHNADGYPVVVLVPPAGSNIRRASMLFDCEEGNVILTIARSDKTITIEEFDSSSHNAKGKLSQRLGALR